MTAYKLTDENGKTRGNTQWGPGVTHEAAGNGELCSKGWIHVYSYPLLAVFLNPIHANFQHPRLWRCEVGGRHRDDRGLKHGWQRVTTVEEIELPVVTMEQRVRFGILCALHVAPPAPWCEWARKWLSSADRSRAAALAALDAAWGWSAHPPSGARAASASAARACAVAASMEASRDAAWAVAAAAEASRDAARARSAPRLDLIALAEKAVRE